MLTTALFAFLLQASAPAPADPPPATERLRAAAPLAAAFPNTTLLGYEVTGRSPRSVRESINESKPADPQGQRHDAVTRWRYQPRWMGRNGQCLPESATVELQITIILPDLATRSALPGREGEAWDRYFDALVAHEVNHARVAQAGAEQMQVAMRAATDCAGMQAAVQGVNSAVQAANDQYDQQTGHGRTEGAVYPRSR
ncbi:MAG: DUF922 domain-containing protein [Brevundimonas sp.]|nr:DUF922 domain-containing protein [Brevundimonas sp.]